MRTLREWFPPPIKRAATIQLKYTVDCSVNHLNNLVHRCEGHI